MSRQIAFIHSALATAGSFRNLIDALKLDDVEPVFVELPGHGKAEDWDRSREYSDQALEVLLDALPREAIPVIGHSFGAMIGLRAVVERPGRVSSLVAIEPPFYAALEGSYMHAKTAADMSIVRKKVDEGAIASATREFVRIWGTGEPWESLDEGLRKYMVARMELVMEGENLLWGDSPKLLRPGRLEQIDIPVTLVEGDASHPSMTSIIDALGRRIPGAEGIIVPGAGHMVPITYSVAVAEAVRDRLVWGFPEDV